MAPRLPPLYLRLRTLPVVLCMVGCGIADPDDPAFAEPRYYAADAADPEVSSLVMFCPNGEAEYVLGGDILERSTYRRQGRTIEIGKPVVARYTLSPDENVVLANRSGAELRRRREFESQVVCDQD